MGAHMTGVSQQKKDSSYFSHEEYEKNITEFPTVCETCLGPNPYVRMQKFPSGGTCHISRRPYTVFRWKAGSDARYKKTVICQEMANIKNVCQVCMLDLDFNLPVQVRNNVLNIQDDVLPLSHVGREYKLNQIDTNELHGVLQTKLENPYNRDLVSALAREEPIYRRNEARACSFYVKGCCNRGIECPYRHELPVYGELTKQNYHDRYYGTNDPVANKILSRAANMSRLNAPSETSMTTLFVGNIVPAITEQDIKDIFQAHGELKSIKMLHWRNCAFVTYVTRHAAERAALSLGKRIPVKGNVVILRWAQTPKFTTTDEHKSSDAYNAMNSHQFGSRLN